MKRIQFLLLLRATGYVDSIDLHIKRQYQQPPQCGHIFKRQTKPITIKYPRQCIRNNLSNRPQAMYLLNFLIYICSISSYNKSLS